MALTCSPAALARSFWLQPRKPRAARICAPQAITLFPRFCVAASIFYYFGWRLPPIPGHHDDHLSRTRPTGERSDRGFTVWHAPYHLIPDAPSPPGRTAEALLIARCDGRDATAWKLYLGWARDGNLLPFSWGPKAACYPRLLRFPPCLIEHHHGRDRT